MSASSGGYRTRNGYQQVNQSTSYLQLSSALSTFGAQDPFQKRMRKPSAQAYQKNVDHGRRTKRMRENARYNAAEKWSYNSNALWDNIAGAQKIPNVENRGITGFQFSPRNPARKSMLKDMGSRNILPDGKMPISVTISGFKCSPKATHRANKLDCMRSHGAADGLEWDSDPYQTSSRHAAPRGVSGMRQSPGAAHR